MFKLYSVVLSFVFLASGAITHGKENMDLLSNSLSKKPSIQFQLPKNQSEWFETTFNFLKPVLKTENGVTKLNELLEMTMPKDGKFDPLDSQRREKTILFTYNTLKGKDDITQINLLDGLIERHKKYLHLK